MRKGKKSEFLSAFGKGFEILKAISDMVRSLGGDDDVLVRLLSDKDRLRQACQIMVGQPEVVRSGEHFTPILDAEVPEHYQSVLVKYRILARAWGIADSVAICYRVRAGFTLKQHAPKFGKCYEDFQYLQGWNFVDEPTVDCLIFWIPCVVPDSTSKTYNEQIQLLSEIRTKYELPAHHLTSLGSVAQNAGLILAHKKATGVLIPLGGKWIRTATSDAGGNRLRLGGHDASGLNCSFWDFDESRYGNVGVFARGVEILGH